MAAFVEQLSETAEWPAETSAQSTLSKDRSFQDGAGPQSRGPAARHDEPHLSGLTQTLERSSRLALLTRVVEAEVLPRLALARSATGDGAYAGALRFEPALSATDGGDEITAEDTDKLVCLLLRPEGYEAVAFIDALRARGAAVEALFLGIISRTARVLGEMWEDDRCDFTQVTIGVGRLQQSVRALSPRFQLAAVRRTQQESVLLLPGPGEQHTFGLVLLGEFFCRAGWHVGGGPAMAQREASDIVRQTVYDIVGFSVGSDLRLDQLSKSIQAVRRASRNRDIGIMVGGPYYIAHPELVGRVGADTGALDASSAVQQASGLLSLRVAAE